MIFHAMDFIRLELNSAGRDINSELGNVGELISNGGINSNTDSNIIISLINVEENRISRDPRNYLKSGTDVFMKNPAIHLNLTLLFTATRSESAYGAALQSIQKVIEFFQDKYVFDRTNTPGLVSGIEKLIFEMVTINLEQLNHLWSILGGRYHPSVAYKVRMVTVDNVSRQLGSVIKEIETKFYME